MKMIIGLSAGFGLLICGMALALRHWDSVATVFKGVIGPGLAVAGLVVLFAASIKRHD